MAISAAPGRVLYSRVAHFANCGKFHPPAGTERLCESTPSSRRQGTIFYLHDPRNPAARLFGPPPGGDGSLRAFAVAVILHQPADYASAVRKDLFRYFTQGLASYVGFAANPRGLVIYHVSRYYSNAPRFSRRSANPLLSYARTVLTQEWLILALLVVPALSLAVTRGSERRGVVIFALSGWALLLGAVSTAEYDPRYAEVAIGPLAAGAAPAVRRAVLQARSLGAQLRRRRSRIAGRSE